MEGLSNYTTNAVERKNQDCKSDRPLALKLAMINVYKIDKNTCYEHIAAENSSSVSYTSKDEETRRKVLQVDKGNVTWYSIQTEWLNMALQNCCSNFLPNVDKSHKRKILISQGGVVKKGQDGAVKKSLTTVTFIPNPQPEVMGRKVKVKFDLKRFLGIISTYNGLNGKYGIYFPSDQQTVEIALDDEDLKLIDD